MAGTLNNGLRQTPNRLRRQYLAHYSRHHRRLTRFLPLLLIQKGHFRYLEHFHPLLFLHWLHQTHHTENQPRRPQ
jgi:hypothetical protein